MKINGMNSVGINPYHLQANKLDHVKSSYRTRADQLEISSEAKVMQQSTTIPPERQEKIDQLKLQVENGTYALDPKSTAQGLINYYLQ